MKVCPKCGELLQYNPYFKADMCNCCTYFKRRTDSVLLNNTIQYVTRAGRNRGIHSGIILNKLIEITLELQQNETLLLSDAYERAFQRVSDGQFDI